MGGYIHQRWKPFDSGFRGDIVSACQVYALIDVSPDSWHRLQSRAGCRLLRDRGDLPITYGSGCHMWLFTAKSVWDLENHKDMQSPLKGHIGTSQRTMPVSKWHVKDGEFNKVVMMKLWSTFQSECTWSCLIRNQLAWNEVGSCHDEHDGSARL